MQKTMGDGKKIEKKRREVRRQQKNTFKPIKDLNKWGASTKIGQTKKKTKWPFAEVN